MIHKILSENLIEVALPPLGAEEGGKATLIRWMFAVGQRIEKGEEIVELEAEKCAFAVESPVRGSLEEIFYNHGDTVEEGQVLAFMRINEK